MALLSIAYLCIFASFSVIISASGSIGIPVYPFTASGDGSYNISALKSILVDETYAGARDTSGETLIPPNLREFADVFAGDLQEALGIKVPVSVGAEPQPDSIFLSIDEEPTYEYVSGEPSAEGYTFEVTDSGIVISGASPLGVWWATRSLLQQSILSEGALPLGKAIDGPGWMTRGMMLDAGRHYYPPEFIVELCAYMSFFKQNTLHLHLSDNLFVTDKYTREQQLSLYARFRLWSDSTEVEGLNKFKNESYTESQFKDMQSECVARGITIIPEIEAPGHALPIVQWKPELGLGNDLSLLNISHPDTIPTMKTIWSTFMDWFESKTVHLGADEYTGEASEYNRFVNEMAKFIHNNGSKSVRIWGTFPPKSEYDNITTDVSIQHWAFFEDNPLYDYIQNNYSVLNSDDTFYVVVKSAGGYPPTVNIDKAFHGNPADNGPWQPNVFDANNATNNPDRSNPSIIGAVAPLWNDFGANASVYSEVYYAWREGIPALADKQWGSTISEEDFWEIFPILRSSIPGQNLERSIPSESATILHYNNSSWAQELDRGGDDVNHAYLSRKDNAEWQKVKDISGNDYAGNTSCVPTQEGTALRITPECTLKTPLSSKGRNYTLSIRFKLDPEETDEGKDQVLISGGDSTLVLTPTVTLFASGNYYRLNSTVPLDTWVDLSVTGRGDRTFASVSETKLESPFPPSAADDSQEEEFQAVLGISGESFVWAPIAIEAPISEVGGDWTGELGGLFLSSEA
ncbi:beta-hexosaminidase [Poronia punctata]|nr:beta-hexosaminidase [Poronia punctata]